MLYGSAAREKIPMVLMLKPSDASHACSEKLVRLNGRPDAKLKNRMAAMRLSPNAGSRVGLVAAVKPRSSTWNGSASAWRAILPQTGSRALGLAGRRVACETAAMTTIAPTLPYQSGFIELCMKLGVLKFGSFRLKSGRDSPYFFNAGLFNTGAAIAAVGRAYAAALDAANVPFDMLFGPAYKGIPLVTVTAAALTETQNRSVGFAFNRKEAKDHGEGGRIVGGPLTGRVLIVDDVVTAGTAIRESVDIIKSAGARPAGVLLALDRQERGSDSDNDNELSAVQEVRERFGIPVIAVIGLKDLMQYMQ